MKLIPAAFLAVSYSAPIQNQRAQFGEGLQVPSNAEHLREPIAVFIEEYIQVRPGSEWLRDCLSGAGNCDFLKNPRADPIRSSVESLQNNQNQEREATDDSMRSVMPSPREDEPVVDQSTENEVRQYVRQYLKNTRQ